MLSNLAISLLAFSFPTTSEWIDAIPIIISLIIIEGLLSVDNALAIAAMANHLPEKQKYIALKLGIIGAYFFRGICLAAAAWIIENPWLKIGGAAYLIYLMSHHFTVSAEAHHPDALPGKSKKRGLVETIIAIEIMDLSLSVDNVVAAVALSPKLWVVCTGVFIGILALRFVAGACIKLIERLPILADTAFLLIGYVGFILVYELLSNPNSGMQLLPGPVHVSTLQKFIGIVFIVTLSLLYEEIPILRRIFQPLCKIALFPMKLISHAVGGFFQILIFPFKKLLRIS